MKGKILDYTIQSGEGIITGQDGNRYTFHVKEWKSNDQSPQKDLEVDFVAEDKNALQIYAMQAVYAKTQETSGAAIISLVFGIIGIAFNWWLFTIPSFIAVVAGHIARSNIKSSKGALVGDGLALGGLVLGYASLVLYLIIFIFIVGTLGALFGL